MIEFNFNTLRFVNNLKKWRFEQKKAEAIANTLKKSLKETNITSKSDLKELEIKLVKWIVGFVQITLLVSILVSLI